MKKVFMILTAVVGFGFATNAQTPSIQEQMKMTEQERRDMDAQLRQKQEAERAERARQQEELRRKEEQRKREIQNNVNAAGGNPRLEGGGRDGSNRTPSNYYRN